jgi:hypothetical protein
LQIFIYHEIGGVLPSANRSRRFFDSNFWCVAGIRKVASRKQNKKGEAISDFPLFG